jgi:hypothetical protein
MVEVMSARCSALLWAEAGRLGETLRSARSRTTRLDTEDLVLWLSILGLIVVVVFTLSNVVKWYERRRNASSPMRLFLSLCRAHRLRWRQRWLLWQLARAQRLKEPALLFLEPQRFELPLLPVTLQAKKEPLREIRRLLFAEAEAGKKGRTGGLDIATALGLGAEKGKPVAATPLGAPTSSETPESVLTAMACDDIPWVPLSVASPLTSTMTESS